MIRDVIIPAVLRPAMLDVALASIQHRVTGDLNSYRLLVNVDPVGGDPADGVDGRAILSDQVQAVCLRYCKNAVVHFAETGSLNEALRWLWSRVESDVCLYWEDDIIAVASVKFPRLVEAVLANERLAFLNIPDRSFVLGRESDHNLVHTDRGGGLYQRTGKYKMTLQPGVLRAEFVHTLAGLLTPSPDPEIQFHTDPAMVAWIDSWEYATAASPGMEKAVVDMGFNTRTSDGWTKLVLPTGTAWVPERTVQLGDLSIRVPDVDESRGCWDQVDERQWRPDSFAVMDRFLKPGMTFVDAGAWMGAFSLYAAHKGCRVLALEPDAVAFNLLAHTVGRNAPLHNQITLSQKAVTGGQDLKLGPWGQSFGGSRSSLLFGDRAGAVAVCCRTLRELLRAHKIGRADYVKMTVQGFEPEILEDAVPHFGDARPVLHVSVQPRLYADRAAGLAKVADALSVYRHVYTEKGVELDLGALPEDVGEVIIVATEEDWGT